MNRNIRTLQRNFFKYWDQFYVYFLRFMYYGTVPSIILYGLFSKPYSPLLMAMWSMLTGEEAEQPMGMYGQPGY